MKEVCAACEQRATGLADAKVIKDTVQVMSAAVGQKQHQNRFLLSLFVWACLLADVGQQLQRAKVLKQNT